MLLTKIKEENSFEKSPIMAYIDLHGHSRQKNTFIYGPYYPLHDTRYWKMRLIPKIMSKKSEIFRFYACKFKIEKSKLSTARLALWKEFKIMNCFTCESSFYGFFTESTRETIVFTKEYWNDLGKILIESLS